MHIFSAIAPLRAHVNTLRSTPNTVGFVPTMGALHEGHLSLIRASKHQNSITICSIYVNPTQFGNTEDLEKYPRTLEDDLALLKREDCDIAFCPDNQEMYGASTPLTIGFPNLDDVLEGKFRPGHFSGVAQVVAKLLNIVQPDRAYFGQKDFQQIMVVDRLVEAMKFNTRIVSMPIIREPDGLAMSSRNQRLSDDGRKQASVLFACLEHARKGILEGISPKRLEEESKQMCSAKGVTLEYLAVADRKEFILLDHVTEPSDAIVLIAAHVGPVRLIDNLFVHP